MFLNCGTYFFKPQIKIKFVNIASETLKLQQIDCKKSIIYVFIQEREFQLKSWKTCDVSFRTITFNVLYFQHTHTVYPEFTLCAHSA